jgi:hypothetical protein
MPGKASADTHRQMCLERQVHPWCIQEDVKREGWQEWRDKGAGEDTEPEAAGGLST